MLSDLKHQTLCYHFLSLGFYEYQLKQSHDGCLPNFPCNISNLICLAKACTLKRHWEAGKSPYVTFWLAPTELACATGLKHMAGEVSLGRTGWYDCLLRYQASCVTYLSSTIKAISILKQTAYKTQIIPGHFFSLSYVYLSVFTTVLFVHLLSPFQSRITFFSKSSDLRVERDWMIIKTI